MFNYLYFSLLIVFISCHSFCILDRKEARSRPDFRTSKRPYSLQHLVMVIPNLFQPPISTSSNVSTISPLYLLATEQTIFNSSNNRYSYDLGIESPHYKDFVHEHFSLVPRSPKELALTLIKPIEGPKDLTLNIDLIFKHKILQRKVLHLFVDERTE